MVLKPLIVYCCIKNSLRPLSVADTIGFDRIALLHLNNTHGEAGSCLDRHALLDKGSIELEALQAFVLHPKMMHIPIIMELPPVAPEQEAEHMRLVREWHRAL